MKSYSILYSVTTSYEAVVKAKDDKTARAKVQEVIGDPVLIESVTEVANEAK